MGLLSKKGIETIDYTYLQKKGFIKKPEEKKLPFKVDSHGMVDLTPHTTSEANKVIESTPASNPFGFLDSLSGAAQTSGSSESQANSGIDSSAEISSVKVKVDDLEYKLERLIEKLSLIEGKLENFEKKVFN